ncbi:Rv0909 family putative TA system antitoxin [Corynebacterium sp. H78]|uniref:Rv0909 family putative TA system antitoxin n=2 Tax=unclassified Corynebacterium TaxID=2624378 RepID=UPI0030976ED5
MAKLENSMGIMDKAKQVLANEEQTDKLLDKAEEFATKKYGADKASHIAKAREVVDSKLGDEKK